MMEASTRGSSTPSRATRGMCSHVAHRLHHPRLGSPNPVPHPGKDAEAGVSLGV